MNLQVRQHRARHHQRVVGIRKQLRARALSDPIYSGNLVSRDGRASVVLAYVTDVPEREYIDAGLVRLVPRD